MKKIEISKCEEEYHTNWCERCDQYYCWDCIDFVEVEGDLIENIEIPNPYFPDYKKNWKGEKLCPWCYNQLVDLKNTKMKKNGKTN